MSKYKTFMGPFGKVFLGAVLTYQIIYWSWLKLEMDESKLEKNGTSNSVISDYNDRYLPTILMFSRRIGRIGEKGTRFGCRAEIA